MSYKSILVPIDGSPAGERRIAVACQLAATFQAEVTGVAIVAPLELPQRLRSNPGAKAILKEEFDKSVAHAKSLVESFPQQARAAGAPAARARLAEGEPVKVLTAASRTADLLVLSQPDADDVGALGGHFIEHALTEVGRPVLLVPIKHDPGTVGRNVLVAWKDAAASARALADARPLLEKAQSVTVLAVDEDGNGASFQEALDYLERHGPKGKGVVVKSDDAGAAILSQAKKSGADLIVMGALARHRLAEMILGGATRTVLEKASTCVLMSH